jgi:methionyl-tRNA synthetase
MVTFDDFTKLDIRIGTILEAERIQDSDKLLKLSVGFADNAVRQIIAGIGEFISLENLIDKQCPFVVNLESRKIRGLMSHGMLLAIDAGEGFALLHPNKKVPQGSKVR